MVEAASEFSIHIDPQNLDKAGETISLAPDDGQRAAIAQRLGLVALPQFTGEIEVRPWGAGGYEVSGTIAARVTQECVVSLEPVENEIEEQFVVHYLPQKALASYLKEEDVMVGEVMDEDPPEPLPDDGFDVGDLSVEYLSLAIDPYPRRDDLAKSQQLSDKDQPDTEKPNPFAVLSDLKK